jgi:prophage antirepressor-like protein
MHASERPIDFGDQAVHVVYNDQGEPWLVVTAHRE